MFGRKEEFPLLFFKKLMEIDCSGLELLNFSIEYKEVSQSIKKQKLEKVPPPVKEKDGDYIEDKDHSTKKITPTKSLRRQKRYPKRGRPPVIPKREILQCDLCLEKSDEYIGVIVGKVKCRKCYNKTYRVRR